MPKKITLNIGQRLAAIRLMNESRVGIDVLAKFLDDVKQLAVTDEEWEKCNLVKTPQPNGMTNWKWDENVDKEVELAKETVEAMLAKIKEKSDAKDLTVADAALIEIQDKLNA